jgi:Bacterial regulatory helix-turn-helix protein, lysR family
MNARQSANDLLAFLAVAKEGSSTRAAAKLGVSQSVLSHTKGPSSSRTTRRPENNATFTAAARTLPASLSPGRRLSPEPPQPSGERKTVDLNNVLTIAAIFLGPIVAVRLTRTRSVSPTEAGDRLLHTVGARFEEIEAELEPLSELRQRPAGTIRITASSTGLPQADTHPRAVWFDVQLPLSFCWQVHRAVAGQRGSSRSVVGRTSERTMACA